MKKGGKGWWRNAVLSLSNSVRQLAALLHTPDTTFQQVDATDWKVAAEEQIGTKPKYWVSRSTDPNNRWLWKSVTQNVSSDGSIYNKGEDWAEKTATELAAILGIPTIQVELAWRRGENGTISSDFTMDRELTLVHGNELLAGANPNYSGEGRRRSDGYTLKAIFSALESVGPPTAPCTGAGNTAFDCFVGYLLLDAVIGNTDRHHQNWGALRDQEGILSLAPTFDHASSLGFLLNEDDRTKRLAVGVAEPGSVELWADHARTPFEGRPHPCDLAAEGARIVSQSVGIAWMDRFHGVVEATNVTLDQVPEDRMSRLAKEFAARLVAHNHERLVSALHRILHA